MPRFKRRAEDAELDVPVEPAVPAEQRETLSTLRNMWEFASLMQYIFLFGHVVKIDDDFEIEDLEAECLSPSPSEKLVRIGLQLLKYVSSHRGLTPEIFEEYTRRQYAAKAPSRNPFGDQEEPLRFNDLDIHTRIKVLQQLSTWTFGNAERIRGLMPQEEDHLGWRMEPIGWDKEDRAYYVLDDNRLYRRTDEPVPPPTPQVKAKSKARVKAKKKPAARKGRRASKRRKIDDSEDDELETEDHPDVDDTGNDDTDTANGVSEAQHEEEAPGYGFTTKTWECVAITLEEYQEFISSIFRSRDPNEKQLRQTIENDVLPVIEKRAEALRQKQLKKARELETLQKIATAKRSSRLADKADKEAKEREERELEEKRQRDLKMARDEQGRQKRIEEGHESRRLTREQRVREREAKRVLYEEELAKLEEDAERAEFQAAEDRNVENGKRASGRQRENQRERHKKELERLADEDGNWYFDCSVCGQHGENMDDGSHSIACDWCNVWQHSKCHGFTPEQAEQGDFVFVCGTCRRKEDDAKKPKIPPLKLHNRNSGSPEGQKSSSRPLTGNGQNVDGLPHPAGQHHSMALAQHFHASARPGSFGHASQATGTNGQAPPVGYSLPPVSNLKSRSPQQPQQQWQASPPAHGFQHSPKPNGYAVHATARHQQQHQFAHQNAVAASGGHPPHPPQYAQPEPHQQPNGYNPRAEYPANQPQQQYQQQYPTQQQWHQPQYQQQAPYPPAQALSAQGSSQLSNGFQSPVKAAPRLASPPHQQQPRPSTTPQAPQAQHIQHLQQSPRTNLPPPRQHSSIQSPIKSSPRPAYQHQQPSYSRSSPSQHPPQLARTPHQQNVEAATANGARHKPQLHTPQMRPPISGNEAISHATHVAADGMSGPWPEGSRIIPQKHDQSPASPASSQSISDTKVFPPARTLAPSPGQQAASVTGSIPVKKMQPSPESPPTVASPLPFPQPEILRTSPQQ